MDKTLSFQQITKGYRSYPSKVISDLAQHVTSSMRHRQSQQPSLLDLIFTLDPNSVDEVAPWVVVTMIVCFGSLTAVVNCLLPKRVLLCGKVIMRL